MGLAVHNKAFGKKSEPNIRLVQPAFIEYGFYACLFYGLLGPAVGVEIDRLGIIFLSGLAFFCSLGFKERSIHFFRLLVFPIGCGISYLIIQIMFFGEGIFSENVKPFIPWIFTLIVVQALSFRRGFLHRFVIFAIITGSVLLLFLDMREYGKEGISRLALEKDVGLSNSNDLAYWFGFCAVYTYIYGVISERQTWRMTSWVIASGCLFVVTLTVSRGALLATIIAIVLGSREFLKRGFFPVLILLILAWILYVSGVFDQTIKFYLMRGTEETGRGLIWPRALDIFINSPLLGVGASNVYVFLPEAGKYATPHNSFLFIAMAGGIIPLILYITYWLQAASAALWAPIGNSKASAFSLPLVVYAFLVCFSSQAAFMNSWVIVALAAAMTTRVSTRPAPARLVPGKK